MEGQCSRKNWGVSSDSCLAEEKTGGDAAAAAGGDAAGGDAAAAVGDPHMTTNSGKHYDLQLLQHDSERLFEEFAELMGQGPSHPVCGCNCNGDLEDNSDPGFQPCCLRAFGNRGFCPGPKSQMEGQCSRKNWGVSSDSCLAEEKTGGDAAAAAGDDAAGGDAAAAVGDPHMTTNSGKHYDYKGKPQLLQHDSEKSFEEFAELMGQGPSHPVCGCNCNGDAEDNSEPGFQPCCLRAFNGRCPGQKS